MNGALHGLPDGVLGDALLRTLFQQNPDALLLVAADGHIALSNPAAVQLLGYRAEELRGLQVDQLVPDTGRTQHAEFRAAYARAPRARPMGTQSELTARRKDGSEVLVEVSLSPLHGLGQPWVLAGLRDISGYPRVRQAMQRARYSEQLARLGRLAADSRDPQVLLPQVPGATAEALRVEAVAVYLLLPNRRELQLAAVYGPVGDERTGAVLPNDAGTPAGFVMAAARPVTVQDYATERRFKVPEAARSAGLRSALGAPLVDRGRPVGVLMVQSRQADRFGEDELRFGEALAHLLATCLQRAQSEEALSHAQRLESVGQLTGGIAHDFNNLLTVIQGNLQVLEELPLLGEQAYALRLVAAAKRASRRGAELTGKLLAFSRRQVLQPSSIDIRSLLHSLADMLRRTLDQRIRIEVECTDDCPPVLADPGQLESALLNIAINARDAMPAGGVLRFRAEACGVLPPQLRHELDDPSATDDGFVAISIADSGSGMTEDVKERAFEPFFTTKEAGRGTGLGLSTVYGFVKQSSGVIAIESLPGTGTTLTLYIPRPWRTSATVDDEAGAAQVIPVGLRVMLVEDDADVREVVGTFLDSLGCRVSAAASAEQALLALGNEARFDLLISDIALGAGMRGTKLAALAQQRFPHMAVLLMSGFSSELLAAERDTPMAWELLRKPYTRAELAAAIARLLTERDDAG